MPKARTPRAAAIYCRISLDGEGSGLGVKRQEADCRALAKQRGWPVARVYVDNNLSAYSGKTRPDYQSMLESIEAGEVDAVIVWHLDRLHRTPRELESFIDTCTAAGINAVATVTADIDLAEGDGLFQARILTAVAAKESDDKRRRLQRKHVELAQQGRPLRAPFGYTYNTADKTLTAHPQQAKEVRQMFERYAAGDSMRAILRDLNKRRVTGQRGRTSWDSTPALTRILDNPTYAGWRHYRGELTRGEWEPIIEQELFDRVQARRKATMASRPALNRKGKGRTVLSGVLFCSCGAAMYRDTYGRDDGRSEYKCSKSATKNRGDCRAGGIKALRAERLVRDAFLDFMAESKYPEWARKAKVKMTRPKVSETERDLKQLEREERRLIAVVREGGGAAPRILLDELQRIEEEKAALELELARSQVGDLDAKRRRAQVEELRALAADLPVIWEAATKDERREMLQAVGMRFTVEGQGRSKRVVPALAA